ncbi:MAG: peptide-methionine (S)-S-oxide reductase MsrA [Actinomycetota bacterium]
MNTQHITLGAGCFWGVEYVFRRVPGVTNAEVGYAGGHVVNPTYKQVCYENTGHAEVTRVSFDPSQITLEQILSVFWAMHDPTQVNRQGPDVGDQYRSAIYTNSDDQLAIAQASRETAQERFKKPIATEIVPLDTFYPGEDYHQQYYEMNGHEPYCHVVPVKEMQRLGLISATPKEN